MDADDGEDGDEFRPAGDSDDDEATLEEEEAAAAAEGGGGGADEMDALLAEAVRCFSVDSQLGLEHGVLGWHSDVILRFFSSQDMPVEELMRRYYGGGGASPAAAAPAAAPAAARPALPAPAAADSELPPGFAPPAVAAFVPPPVVLARPVPPRLVLPPPPPPLSPRSDALRGARCAAAREREDALIFRARHLREEASRRAAERAVPAAKPDPARNKTHWDHLLEEMAWLARDSERERKWKRKQARKAATAVKGSRLDIESRAVAREAAEVASLRRIASTCAREVRVFWGKAEKLVRIKANMALEAQRKSAMDKHLEFVMAQTERYCNLVATKLTAAPPAGGAAPQQPRRALQAAPADDDEAFEPEEGDEGMDDDDEATLDEQMEVEEAEGGGAAAAAAEAAALAAEQDAPLEDLLPPELLARYRAGGAATPSDASDASDDEEEDDVAEEAGDADAADADDADAPALRELARSPPPGAAADANGGAADDDPSSSFEGGSEEDDEATLEEEEAAAAAEGGAEDAREAEMDALKAEADLPLDELLRRMGYNPGAGDDDDDVADGEEDGDGAEASSGEEEEDDEGGAGDESGGDEGEEAAGRWAHALLASPPAKGGGAGGGGGDEEAEAGRRGLEEFAASAGVAQPTGHTLATTAVSTTVPFLMKAQLREYQHVGLDWLVALYEKQLNGILADEMVRPSVGIPVFLCLPFLTHAVLALIAGPGQDDSDHQPAGAPGVRARHLGPAPDCGSDLGHAQLGD